MASRLRTAALLTTGLVAGSGALLVATAKLPRPVVALATVQDSAASVGVSIRWTKPCDALQRCPNQWVVASRVGANGPVNTVRYQGTVGDTVRVTKPTCPFVSEITVAALALRVDNNALRDSSGTTQTTLRIPCRDEVFDQLAFDDSFPQLRYVLASPYGYKGVDSLFTPQDSAGSVRMFAGYTYHWCALGRNRYTHEVWIMGRDTIPAPYSCEAARLKYETERSA